MDSWSDRPPLGELIAARAAGILLFSVTPPKVSTPSDRVTEIADITTRRLSGLALDGLILYDIDDESDRTSDDRPFPYLPTIDPATFRTDYLTNWRRPVIIYRCVGKYSEQELSHWLRSLDGGDVLSVFVGASSSSKEVQTDLAGAQALREEIRPDVLLGGVIITERHAARGDEHLRMLAKQERGSAFFVSQVVYDIDATRSLVSDYAHACLDRGIAPRPLVFTLAVCGSTRTLEFLDWLGVVVPGWLQNDLRRSEDPLAVSYAHCLHCADDLIRFSRRLGVPVGFNVESVSIRRVEIEAAVALAADLRSMMDADPGGPSL